MNERIRELAKQALDYAEKNQLADIPQHWFELHNKKFAELILQDCLNTCADYADFTGVAQTIAKHLRSDFWD